MLYSIPNGIKALFPSILFSGDRNVKKVFLTFDDGPIPEVTPHVLDLLREAKAIATFFEVGENVQKHPLIHQRIIDEGHLVANHTFNHLSGWKTDAGLYLENVSKANELINSQYFRPPYGRVTPRQIKLLELANYQLVYWDVISRDYDQSISEKACLDQCIKKIKNGNIFLFHDSLKAKKNLYYALPKLLDILLKEGYAFGTIDQAFKPS